MAEEDDGVRELEPLLKREPVDVLIPSPLVPQLELSRRISESDSEGQETVPLLTKPGPSSSIHDDTNEADGNDGNDGNEGNDANDSDGGDGGGAGGKIKVEYIENRRARGATFNKRRNGILKKAYELSELTGTVVCAVVFNENRNKLYEYCSVEQPGVVFDKIANYYGYAERRQNNSLKNPSKGYINIPNNETALREAAIAAAQTANIRHDTTRVAGVQQKRNKHNNVKVPAISNFVGRNGNDDGHHENNIHFDINGMDHNDNDNDNDNNGYGYEQQHIIADGFDPQQDITITAPEAGGNDAYEEEENSQAVVDAETLMQTLIPGDENGKHELSLDSSSQDLPEAHDLEDLFADENLLLQPPIHFGDLDSGEAEADAGADNANDNGNNNNIINRRFDLESMQVVEMPRLAETAPLKYEVLVFPRTSSNAGDANDDE